MITAQVESFTEQETELRGLIDRHYEELSLHKGRYPLSPQWHVYREREQRDELVFVTLRRDGQMIGYWITFVTPGLHYSTCLTAIMDIWFVSPDHVRGKAPLVLARAVKRELTRRGVNLWFAGSKNHKPCGPFLERLGFEEVETYYSMWLGD